MEVSIIGLGKMGLNLALNLLDHGFNVKGMDVNEHVVELAKSKNIDSYSELDELLDSVKDKKIIWLMLPSGEITETIVKRLSKKLNPEDIVIDGGNSNYKDSLRRYHELSSNKIRFLDCGTSGGMDGSRNGACLMVGGDKEIFRFCEPIFKALSCEGGYLYTGLPGSGHYLKMIHNGIEYGMMQAIGEGFDVLNACQYEYDLVNVAKLWNHGSVIRSWLMELAEDAFNNDAKLSSIKGIVNASGEAKWTVQEGLDLEIPLPVISSSLYVRNMTKIDDSFAAKVVASLRNGFGGHEVIIK